MTARSYPAVALLAALTLSGGVASQTGVWTQAPLLNPPVNEPFEMCWDASLSRVVAVDTELGVTFSLMPRANAWRRLQGAVALGNHKSVAYDSAAGKVYCAGAGIQNDPISFQTLSLGNIWTPVTTATTPAALTSEICIVYDSMRDVIVLWGGTDSSGSMTRSETWEYDGTDWTLRTTGGPIPRTDVQMVYDPTRGRTVLFGGRPRTGLDLGDTWEWDGFVWRQLLVPGPTPRAAYAFGWDPNLGQAVLYGGRTQSPVTATHFDTWTWDGTTWTQLTTVGDPGRRTSGDLIYYPLEDRIVLAGGTTSNDSYYLDIIQPQSGSVSAFGTGCGSGPLVAPTLAASQGDLPFVGELFEMDVASVVPGSSLFGVLGASNSQWNTVPLPLDLTSFGFAGCSALVSLDVIVPLTALATSTPWNLDIPNDLLLTGSVVYAQAVQLTATGNPVGSTWTNALEIRIGSR